MHEKSYGIIPLQNGKVFIVRHKAGDYWGFPKGHHTLGETPQDTAIRELKEETNLEVLRLHDSPTYMESYSFVREGDEIHKTVLYFVAEVSGKAAQLTPDVVEGKWVPLHECETHVTFEENKRIAREVIAKYG